MTLLVSWVGIDTHGPASIYIAADSRVTWGASRRYDHGRKVFACRNSADIFGYCGDVLFPSMVLAQIVDIADAGLLFDPDAPPSERSRAVTQKLCYQFATYPHDVSEITVDSLEVLHAARHNTEKVFECHLLTWKRADGWKKHAVDLPKHSDVLFARGSGAKDFQQRYLEYKRGPNADTSRGVFHCFSDSLLNSGIHSVGGAPQLAGLIRKPESVGKYYGIIASDHRYLLGARVDELSGFDRVEWRNELFEVCDGGTRKRRPNAQAQPNPRVR
jgi:hypothetical protein